MNTLSRITAVAASALLLVTLAACSAPDDAAAPATAEPTAAAALPEALTDVTDSPGTGENLVGALADVAVAGCERDGDAWSVDGTATNPTDAAADYRIYVSLLDGAGATRALVQADVDAVEAGASTDWTTSIPVAEDALECVLRVERYSS